MYEPLVKVVHPMSVVAGMSSIATSEQFHQLSGAAEKLLELDR